MPADLWPHQMQCKRQTPKVTVITAQPDHSIPIDVMPLIAQHGKIVPPVQLNPGGLHTLDALDKQGFLFRKGRDLVIVDLKPQR